MRGANKYEKFKTIVVDREVINEAYYNPRKITAARRKKLKNFLESEKGGLLSPLTWNQRTKNLVGGHQRLKILDALHKGKPYKLTVAVVDMDELDEVRANIFMNNPNAQGEWDVDKLHEIHELFPDLDFTKDLAFEEKDLNILGLDFGDSFFNVTDDENTGTESDENRHKIPKQATLIGPNNIEHQRLDGRMFLVEYSGGIDSSAAVLWLKQYYADAEVILLYVDMGADYYGMHDFLFAFADRVGYELRTLRAHENIIDRFYRDGAWPHALHPYCHELLHAALDAAVKQYAPDDVVIVRGGRASERSGNTKVKPDRFLEIKRMLAYTYFQPLYYCDKSVGRAELLAAGWPTWPGYDTGLGRTACRVCPGQNQGTYATIRAHYPAVWSELMALQTRLGCGAWNDPVNNNFTGDFNVLADRGDLKNT